MASVEVGVDGREIEVSKQWMCRWIVRDSMCLCLLSGCCATALTAVCDL